MIAIGIDPGKGGFVAILDGNIIETHPCPTVSIGTKQDYDGQAMRRILSDYSLNSFNVHVFIEKQQSFPKQGVVSTFSTGEGFGLWKGICIGLDLPFTVVRSQEWRKETLKGVQGTDNKGRSIIAAGRLFPGVDLRRSDKCKKPCHDKAEALLIAEYGRRLLK